MVIAICRNGVEYAKIMGKSNPKVGLLNVGTEENKGTDRESKPMLTERKLGDMFYGNIEGSDINIGTAVDVVVTDGFSGIVMKTMEGASKLFSP